MGASALVIVGILAAAVITDLQAQARTRNELRTLAQTRHDLSTTRFTLAATTFARALSTNHREALKADITSTRDQLATTEQELTFTHADAFLLGLGVGTLQTCLGGVQGSLQAIAAHDNNGAARDLSAVSSACTTLTNGTKAGLVYPFDFPDPTVLHVGNNYFAYATNSVEGNIAIIKSTDLVTWNEVGNALPSLPAWVTPGATWAPGVFRVGGTFALYYSAKVAGPGNGEECISVATAKRPEGPFVDTSTAPLECQASLGGSIDPSPFVDADGTPYLQWKSIGAEGQPATIWSQQLDSTGTGFATVPGSMPVALIMADQPWEAGVVEAPDLVVDGGRYFLFYSGNNWNSADYAVGVATCAGPLGPCTKPLPQPILASGPNVLGPGGASVFTDASGATWIAFDGYAPGAVGYPNSRDLYLQHLDLSGATPVVTMGS
ncbi:MAG TPA: glycoside hydrolase family 43 protein [Acidimicrobiales bacterium]